MNNSDSASKKAGSLGPGLGFLVASFLPSPYLQPGGRALRKTAETLARGALARKERQKGSPFSPRQMQCKSKGSCTPHLKGSCFGNLLTRSASGTKYCREDPGNLTALPWNPPSSSPKIPETLARQGQSMLRHLLKQSEDLSRGFSYRLGP